MSSLYVRVVKAVVRLHVFEGLTTNRMLSTVPRRYLLCGSFVLFMSCVVHAFASVYCCLVVTCWERADLLAFVSEVLLFFVTFPCGIVGKVWYLIVSITDLCRLSFFLPW